MHVTSSMIPKPASAAPAPLKRRTAAAGALGRTTRRLGIFTLLIGAGIAFAGFRFGGPWQPAPRLRLERVTRGAVTLKVVASGQVQPARKVDVGSAIAGQIRAVKAEDGAAVRAGEPLAEMDRTAFAAAVTEAETGLSNARAALANARSVLKLAQRHAEQSTAMQGQGLIAQADMDKALADVEQAKGSVTIAGGSVRIAAAGVTRARADLDRCTIRSPIDGVVIGRNAEVGQVVSAGGAAPLFVIAGDLRMMQVEAGVSEADIGSLQPGQEAAFTVDAYPDRTFPGVLAQVRSAATVDQSVVSYPVVIQAENPSGLLRPGMTASVDIITERREKVLTVPAAALRFRPTAGGPAHDARGRSAPDDGTATVFRPGPAGADGAGGDRAPEPVRIVTGLSDGRHTEVVSGLAEGDEVVVGVRDPDKKQNGLLAWIPSMLTGGAGHRRK